MTTPPPSRADLLAKARAYLKENHPHLYGPANSGIAETMAEFTEGEMVQWQDIETAPKDGTAILVWNNGEIAHVKWGGEFHNAWILFRGLGFYDFCTHWMPLPQPPTSEANEGE